MKRQILDQTALLQGPVDGLTNHASSDMNGGVGEEPVDTPGRTAGVKLNQQAGFLNSLLIFCA